MVSAMQQIRNKAKQQNRQPQSLEITVTYPTHRARTQLNENFKSFNRGIDFGAGCAADLNCGAGRAADLNLISAEC